jgi:leucyl aminopeptidase (aminopeptidase T)
VDGSIPHPKLGLIKKPITILVEGGRISKIEGGHETDILRKLLLDIQDENVYMIGEIGISMNACSKLCDCMLEDEGCMGTAHIDIGNNIAFGGIVEDSNHLNLITKSTNIYVDGKDLMLEGILIL